MQTADVGDVYVTARPDGGAVGLDTAATTVVGALPNVSWLSTGSVLNAIVCDARSMKIAFVSVIGA